jgi:hypothetical protein
MALSGSAGGEYPWPQRRFCGDYAWPATTGRYLAASFRRCKFDNQITSVVTEQNLVPDEIDVVIVELPIPEHRGLFCRLATGTEPANPPRLDRS